MPGQVMSISRGGGSSFPDPGPIRPGLQLPGPPQDKSPGSLLEKGEPPAPRPAGPHAANGGIGLENAAGEPARMTGAWAKQELNL